MTAQQTDSITINDDVHMMYGFPLEQYWEQNNNKPPLLGSKTSLRQRGYYAKWLIENNKLFLIEFYGEYWSPAFIDPPPPKKEYSLIDLFPSEEEKVFAEWFTGDIIIPMGKIANFSLAGRGSTYEYKTTIKFYKGIVIDSGSFLIE